jgi:ASC-1-like (ASCH) protein
MKVNVRPVITKFDLKQFLDVPFGIYGRGSQWVAPLYFERFEHLSPKKNPYFRHAEVQLFLAEIDGKPVGRISAQVCKLHLERYKDDTGQFGFLEAPDDPEVFKALFDVAKNWLRSRGMRHVRGPFNFSINDEVGLLIKGFDTPPSIMMGHALPYYAKQVENAGFRKIKDIIAYDFDAAKPLQRTLNMAYERALRTKDIQVRALDKKNMDRDLDIMMSIFNDAWENNWGFIPFTPEEVKALGTNFKLLLKNEYIAIASYKGKPAAFVVTVPNINEWLDGLGGKLLPFGWAKIVRNVIRGRPSSIRMPLMGIRKEFHDSLLGSSLALSVIETVRRYHTARGAIRGELSWILEDNMPMRHIIESFGAVPYKTYRIYEMTL